MEVSPVTGLPVTTILLAIILALFGLCSWLERKSDGQIDDEDARTDHE